MLATPRVAAGLAPLNGLVCTHESHVQKAYGLTPSGESASQLSAQYPKLFCVAIVCAHLRLPPPGVDSSGKSPIIVPASMISLTALSSTPRRAAFDAGSSVSASCRLQLCDYSAPETVGMLTCGGHTTSVSGRSAESLVRAPHYVEPCGPGWWDNVDENDVSDDDDGVFAVSNGAVTTAYRACFKVISMALKAAVRTRYSLGPSGESRTHEIPRGYDEAATHPECARI